MPELSGRLVVVGVAFAVPFLLGLRPGTRVPSAVLEIAAGGRERAPAPRAAVGRLSG